jgi:hypothetical protein
LPISDGHLYRSYLRPVEAAASSARGLKRKAPGNRMTCIPLLVILIRMILILIITIVMIIVVILRIIIQMRATAIRVMASIVMATMIAAMTTVSMTGVGAARRGARADADEPFAEYRQVPCATPEAPSDAPPKKIPCRYTLVVADRILLKKIVTCESPFCIVTPDTLHI